jgi:hypothetical protein
MRGAPGPAGARSCTHSILQIVPSRTRYGGIANYAVRLAEGLLDQHGIGTTFLSGSPQDADSTSEDPWPTIVIEARSRAALDAAFRRADEICPFSLAILHMAGYGYQRRGVPIWLASGLRSYRTHSPDRPFVGVFHELHVTGSITTSAFWLGSLQKLVAQRIWGLVDHGITTNTLYYETLRSWRPGMGTRAWIMPVMSTIGEPSEVSAIGSRAPRLVTFGGPGIARLAETKWEDLRHLIDSYAIQEIHDVGERSGQAPPRLWGVPVVYHGRLPERDIADILSSSRIGILPYANMQVMGKSTILAAYAAYGVVPCAIDPFNADGDGLCAGVHYLIATPDLEQDLDAMQRNVRHWYLQHSLAEQSARIAALLAPVGEITP